MSSMTTQPETEYTPTPGQPSFQDNPLIQMPDAVLRKHKEQVWKHRFDVQIAVTDLVAGTPSNQRVAEGWLRTRLQGDDAQLATIVEQTMKETGKSMEEAVEKTIENLGGALNVFKRFDGMLVFEGRNVKAALKEAAMVALAGGHFGAKTKWGKTGKGLQAFIAEHVMVPERYIIICSDPFGTPYTEPTNVQQRFVHTFRGSSISYEEVCDPAYLNFEVWSDWDFEEDQPGFWETLMVIGEEQGIGACRSLSYGRYTTTLFNPI